MREKAFTVGVDIGGTNTVVGIVDNKGNCLHKTSIPMSDQGNAEIFLKTLSVSIKELCAEVSNNQILCGIGVAAPAARHHKGIVKNPANLQWGTVNLVDMLSQYFDVPIAITNDSNAAALGELKYGLAQGKSNFITITLGTGLGAGIIVDGKLLYGHNSMAGELGHIIIEPQGRQCGCGRRGCVETYVSAQGLRRTVFELLATRTDNSKLRMINYENLTSIQIYDLAHSNDPIAREAFSFTGEYLGRMLANTVAAFDPEMIILSGGLSNAQDLLIEPTRKSFKLNALEWHRESVEIKVSQLHYAALLGASCLVSDGVQRNDVDVLASCTMTDRKDVIVR
jgi:glucokinase